MSTLDKILEPLRDGKWHSLKEINEEVGRPEDKLKEVIEVFAKYRFIQLDRRHKRAKLTSSVLEFFTKTQLINREG